MKTFFAPDEAPVPAIHGGGGDSGPSPSRDTASLIDAVHAEFRDSPRAAIVDAMESCLLELEGEVDAGPLKNCMRRRLRGQPLPPDDGASAAR